MIYKKIQKHFQQSSRILMMWQKPKLHCQRTVSIVMKAVFTSSKKAFNITDSCCQCMVSKNSRLQSLTSFLPKERTVIPNPVCKRPDSH